MKQSSKEVFLFIETILRMILKEFYLLLVIWFKDLDCPNCLSEREAAFKHVFFNKIRRTPKKETVFEVSQHKTLLSEGGNRSLNEQ